MTTPQNTKVEIALTELLEAFPVDWREEHQSTAFVMSGSRALMIEDTGTALRVSDRRMGTDGWLSTRRAWVLGTTYDGRIGTIEDDRRRPVTPASAEQLINLIWAYKRQAVEDAVAVRRTARRTD